jgi:hypothetical protein
MTATWFGARNRHRYSDIRYWEVECRAEFSFSANGHGCLETKESGNTSDYALVFDLSDIRLPHRRSSLF